MGGNLLKLIYGMNVVNSPNQKEEGIEDSKEAFKADTMRSGEGMCNEKLIETMSNKSNEAYQYLVDLGVQFESLHRLGGHSVKRSLFTVDCNQILNQISHLFYQFVDQELISVFFGCRVTDIVQHQDRIDISFETVDKGKKN